MVFLRLVGFCINLLLILLKILAPCRVPCIPAWTPQGKLLWPSTCQHAFASQWFQEHRFLGYSRLKLPLSTVQDASQKNEAFTHLIHLIVVYLYIIMLLKLCCVYVYIYTIYIYAVYIYIYGSFRSNVFSCLTGKNPEVKLILMWRSGFDMLMYQSISIHSVDGRSLANQLILVFIPLFTRCLNSSSGGFPFQ